MGAVNTVYRKGNQLFGENTDGKGFLASLRKDGQVDPAGKQFVVLGAGGAARAITVELALAGAKRITVVNRDPARGRTLVDLLNAKTPVEAQFASWTKPFSIPTDIDVLVNATSIGLYPNIQEKANIDYDTIKEGMTVCDVIPNPPRTTFLREAEKRGAKTLDGLGMLVYQGAIGFKLWTGEEAPMEVMKEALLKEFSAG
jgi:shikimate dehydrogenase